MSSDLKKTTKRNVKPGQKICTRCKMQYMQTTFQQSDSPSSDELQMDTSEKLNRSLTSLGTSPLKIPRLTARDKPSYVKRKIERVQDIKWLHKQTGTTTRLWNLN